MTVFFAVLQQTDLIAAQLDRMATMMMVLAISAVIVGLLSAITLIVSLMTMRSASKLMKTIESQIERLAPKTDPLIEKLTRLTDDARGVTDSVRRRVTDLMDTISDVNEALRGAHRAADTRVREFAAVLDVVQSETEEVLLDGAATARGVHATAEALRGAAHPSRHGVPRHAMDPHAQAGAQPDGVDDDDDAEAAEPEGAPAIADTATVSDREPKDD
ncbi:MAG TPA: hypothetical protein VMM79_00365 [Longimicrobiales bacterium]|nr:hypothetical protein [Longimicrobiales bacterium]